MSKETIEAQHIAWMRSYLSLMTEDNWRDMRDRCSHQLDRLTAAFADGAMLKAAPMTSRDAAIEARARALVIRMEEIYANPFATTATWEDEFFALKKALLLTAEPPPLDVAKAEPDAEMIRIICRVPLRMGSSSYTENGVGLGPEDARAVLDAITPKLAAQTWETAAKLLEERAFEAENDEREIDAAEDYRAAAALRQRGAPVAQPAGEEGR